MSTTQQNVLSLITKAGFILEDIPPLLIVEMFGPQIEWLKTICASTIVTNRPAVATITTRIKPEDDLQRIAFELLQVNGLRRFIEGLLFHELKLFPHVDGSVYTYPSFTVYAHSEFGIMLRKVEKE
jgi:hypothetical protein